MIKRLLSSLFITLIGASFCFADTTRPSLRIQTEDGTVTNMPRVLKVTNGALIDQVSVDGSMILNISGGGGGSSSLETIFGSARSSPTLTLKGNEDVFTGIVIGSTMIFTANPSSVTLQGNSINLAQLAIDTGTLHTSILDLYTTKVSTNAPIVGDTKTKITYDAKGLITSGSDATTSDIAEGARLYFTIARATTAVDGITLNTLTVSTLTIPGQLVLKDGTVLASTSTLGDGGIVSPGTFTWTNNFGAAFSSVTVYSTSYSSESFVVKSTSSANKFTVDNGDYVLTAGESMVAISSSLAGGTTQFNLDTYGNLSVTGGVSGASLAASNIVNGMCLQGGPDGSITSGASPCGVGGGYAVEPATVTFQLVQGATVTVLTVTTRLILPDGSELSTNTVTGQINFGESDAPVGENDVDILYGDQTAHWLRFNPNNTTYYSVVGSSGAVTIGHCAKFSATGALLDAGYACVGLTSLSATDPIFYNNTTGAFTLGKISLSTMTTGSLPATSIAAGSLGASVIASSLSATSGGLTAGAGIDITGTWPFLTITNTGGGGSSTPLEVIFGSARSSPTLTLNGNGSVFTGTVIGATMSFTANPSSVTLQGNEISIAQLAFDTGTLHTSILDLYTTKVATNAAIVGATRTKITYDSKGLVTSGADATTTDIAEGANLYYTLARATTAVNGITISSITIGTAYITLATISTATVSSMTANNFTGKDLYITAQPALTGAGAAGQVRLYAETTQGFTRLERVNEAYTHIILGRDEVFIGRNESGGALYPGQVVHVTGATGNVPNVSVACASTTTNASVIGVVVDTISLHGYGQLMTGGILSNIDTSAKTGGDNLYVSTDTSGYPVVPRPTYPYAKYYVGQVLTAAKSGSIQVAIGRHVGNWDSGTVYPTFTVGADSTTGIVLNSVGRSSFTFYEVAFSTIYVYGKIVLQDGTVFNSTSSFSDLRRSSFSATDPIFYNNTTGAFTLGKISLSTMTTGSLPASSIAAGSLGASVLASSIAANSIYPAAVQVGVFSIQVTTATHVTDKISLSTGVTGSLPAASIAAGSLGASVIASSLSATSGSLTQGANITITGTWPNLTIAATAGTGSGIVSPGTFTWTNNFGLDLSTLTAAGIVTSTATISSATLTLASIDVAIISSATIYNLTVTTLTVAGTGDWPVFVPFDNNAYRFAGSSATVTVGHMAIYSSTNGALVDGGVPGVGGGGFNMQPTTATVNISSGLALSGSAGTLGQVLTSQGPDSIPVWASAGGGSTNGSITAAPQYQVARYTNAGSTTTVGGASNLTATNSTVTVTGAMVVDVMISSGTKPASSCGTSPTIVGNSSAFTVTAGASTDSCAIGFNPVFIATPTCVVSERQVTTTTMSYTVTPSTITFSKVGIDDETLDVICFGHLVEQPAPINPVVSAVHQTSITVTWTSVASEKGYVIEGSTTNFDGTGTLYSSATANGTGTTLTLVSLTAASTYYLKAGSLWNDGTTTYANTTPASTTTLVSGGGSAPTFVHCSSMTLESGNSAAHSSTWTVTAGNTIVMFVVEGGTQGNFSPTSTQGDTFVQVAPTGSIYQDSGHANMFYVVNAVGGPTQFRFSDPDWNGGQTGIACEYSGMNDVAPLDVYSSSATTFEGGTSATTGSTTTTTTNELMFSAWYNGGNFSEITAYTGTQRYQSSDNINFAQDDVVASPGSYESTVTFDGGAWHWIGMQAAFKP